MHPFPHRSFVESRFVEVRGLQMHARVTGTGPDVVLLHGLLASHRYWQPAMAKLAQRARCWAPDLPGHGHSEGGGALHPWQRADLLTEWMDAVGLDDAHIVGNSTGCRVAAALAARHPERVRRLVLHGVVEPRRGLVEAVRWTRAIRREPWLPWRAALRDLRDQGPVQPLRERRLDHRDDLERWLRDVQAPTLVVRGERDALTPPAWTQHVVDQLSDGRLAVLPGGHIMHTTQAKAWVEVVTGFLGLEE